MHRCLMRCILCITHTVHVIINHSPAWGTESWKLRKTPAPLLESDRHPARRTHSPALPLQLRPRGDAGKSLLPVRAHLIKQTAMCASDLHFPNATTPIEVFWGVIRVSKLGRWMIEY